MGFLADHADSLRARGEKALAAFVTAGDPSLEALPEILGVLVENGADVIEIGIPFSDPIADGPVIQASSQRALDRGVTPTAILDLLAQHPVSVPVVLMGYYNPVLRFGEAEYASASRRAGASAALISDLTPEEAETWCESAAKESLDTVFLVAPTSTDNRVKAACERTTGFVYAVSRTGVTGAGSEAGDAKNLVSRIKSESSRPVYLGFGISRPEHARDAAGYADGVIVGSAIVQLLSRESSWADRTKELGVFIRSLKQSLG